MAEDTSGVVIRLQELHGKVCKGVKLSSLKPILAAEELDGAERALDIHLATKKGKVSIDFGPYELKTLLLKIEGAQAIPELTQAIELDYDTDIFSYNSNREDGYMDRSPRSEGHRGSLDGKGGTYPAEMIGDKVQLGNISFSIGFP
jgi:hypothetical protein